MNGSSGVQLGLTLLQSGSFVGSALGDSTFLTTAQSCASELVEDESSSRSGENLEDYPSILLTSDDVEFLENRLGESFILGARSIRQVSSRLTKSGITKQYFTVPYQHLCRISYHS
jgi:hypothetical protein